MNLLGPCSYIPLDPRGRGCGGMISFSCPNRAFRPPRFIWNRNPKPRQTCACRSLTLLDCGESRLFSSLLPFKPWQTAQLTGLLKTFKTTGFKRGGAQFSKAQSFALPKMPGTASPSLVVLGGLGRRGSEEWKERRREERKRRGSWKSVKINRLDRKKRNPKQLQDGSPPPILKSGPGEYIYIIAYIYTHRIIYVSLFINILICTSVFIDCLLLDGISLQMLLIYHLHNPA